MSSGSGDKHSVQREINVTPLIDVLLVLLIIFLVVMPIMTKVETLHVPRTVDPELEVPERDALTIKVRNDLSIGFNDGSSELDMPILGIDVAAVLRPKLETHLGDEKVVFVDFEGEVPWSEVVGTMDTIRSLAADVNHDEIKVALKISE
jgi:biopolymer transport protein ExbD